MLTHGVGPMRTDSIGAILLDLDEPHRVIAELERPTIAIATLSVSELISAMHPIHIKEPR